MAGQAQLQVGSSDTENAIDNPSSHMPDMHSHNSVVSDSPPQVAPLATSTPIPSSSTTAMHSSTPTRNVPKRARKATSSAVSLSNDVSNNAAGPDDNYKINSEPDVSSLLHKFASTNANVIANVIGFSPEIVQFDRLHSICKTSSVSVTDQNAYKDILASLQVQVLRQHSIFIASMKQIEKECFSKSQHLPSADNEEYHVLRQKIKQAKALLRSLSIKF